MYHSNAGGKVIPVQGLGAGAPSREAPAAPAASGVTGLALLA